MILYLDTSAAVKLYVQEAGSTYIRKCLQQCDGSLISAVGYPETRAAFARAFRHGLLSPTDYDRVKQRFELDWLHFAVVPATEPTLRLAGDLTERHKLRGFDAVHLASAIVARDAQQTTTVSFATWDAQLGDAARSEHFEVLVE